MNIYKVINLINDRKLLFSEFLYSGFLKKSELNILKNKCKDVIINKCSNCIGQNPKYIYVTIEKVKKIK
tara:strand:+ start:150 stop:356 length:207 start_codon:yes stop_codon:yes gene_type:complete